MVRRPPTRVFCHARNAKSKFSPELAFLCRRSACRAQKDLQLGVAVDGVGLLHADLDITARLDRPIPVARQAAVRIGASADTILEDMGTPARAIEQLKASGVVEHTEWTRPTGARGP
jgi:hypothetical protein